MLHRSFYAEYVVAQTGTLDERVVKRGRVLELADG
jgi:hypothetical protein